MCILSFDYNFSKLIALVCSYQHFLMFTLNTVNIFCSLIPFFPFSPTKVKLQAFQSTAVFKIEAWSVFWVLSCPSFYLILLLNCNDNLSSASFRSFNIFKRKRVRRFRVSRTPSETWSSALQWPKTPASHGDGFERALYATATA